MHLYIPGDLHSAALLDQALAHSAVGGYTGDCLGAAQQISEVLGYLIWLSLQQLQIIRLNPLIDSLLFS